MLWSVKTARQITVRIEAGLAKALEDGAKEEDLTLADFARKLLRSGMGLYEKAGSLHALRGKEGKK